MDLQTAPCDYSARSQSWKTEAELSQEELRDVKAHLARTELALATVRQADNGHEEGAAKSAVAAEVLVLCSHLKAVGEVGGGGGRRRSCGGGGRT